MFQVDANFEALSRDLWELRHMAQPPLSERGGRVLFLWVNLSDDFEKHFLDLDKAEREKIEAIMDKIEPARLSRSTYQD